MASKKLMAWRVKSPAATPELKARPSDPKPKDHPSVSTD